MGMQEKGDNINTLVELGLTKTQARIYLTLAERGILSIRLVAEYSGVGRPETYRAMLELNHRGLAETILSSPTTYKPLPIPDAVNLLMEQKQQAISQLKEKTKKLLEDHKKETINQASLVEREFVLLPKGKSGINKAIAAIKAAQSTIEFIISIKKFNQLLVIASDDLIESAKRGVKIYLIVDKNNLNKSLSKIFNKLCTNASFKYIDKLPKPFTAVFDNTTILMETAENDFCQSTMLWSNNIVFVDTIHNYFKVLWSCNQSKMFKPMVESLEGEKFEIADFQHESLDNPLN